MKALRIFAVAVALLCAPAIVSAQLVVHTVSITTDVSGDATVYTPPTFGTVVAVRYVPGASAIDGAASLTITDNGTGLQVLTISALGSGERDFWPRAFTMSTTGVTATFDGTTTVLDLVPVAGAVKVVVAAGGNTTTGTVYIFVQGR